LTYYIGFDEYTLYQVEMHNFCEKITKESESKIICTNIVDVSLGNEESNESLLTLSECLKNLPKLDGIPDDQPVNVVIDEYDSEKLTTEEAENLKSILNEDKRFSQVIIAVQSCQKKRQIEKGKQIKEHQSHCFEETGMKVFELCKTMRFTGSIHSVLSSSQEKVGEQTNSYYIASENVEIMPDSLENKTRRGGDNEVPEDTTMGPVGKITRNERDTSAATVLSNSSKNRTMRKATPETDSLFNDNSETNAGPNKITTKYEYTKKFTNGHRRMGEIPEILKISDYSNTSLAMMQYFLNDCLVPEDNCTQENNKLLLICNSKNLLRFTKYSLDIAKIKYVEYTDCIRGVPACHLKEKKEILRRWNSDISDEESAQVLLVDCRGCRGMESKKVRIFQCSVLEE